MGYWILIAMMACALAAVVIAIAIEHRGKAGQRHRLRNGEFRWLAVVTDQADPLDDSWAAHLLTALPDSVEPEIVAAPGTTTAELQAPITQAVAERRPDVLLLWTSFDDVLAGIPLHEHERVLDSVLDDLAGVGVTAVIGNVPDLARLPGTAGAGLPADELQLLADRWNAAIARLAHHHGALVADLRDLIPLTPGFDTTIDMSARLDAPIATPAAVADRFLPVLRQALVGARRRRSADLTTDAV